MGGEIPTVVRFRLSNSLQKSTDPGDNHHGETIVDSTCFLGS